MELVDVDVEEGIKAVIDLGNVGSVYLAETDAVLGKVIAMVCTNAMMHIDDIGIENMLISNSVYRSMNDNCLYEHYRLNMNVTVTQELIDNAVVLPACGHWYGFENQAARKPEVKHPVVLELDRPRYGLRVRAQVKLTTYENSARTFSLGVMHNYSIYIGETTAPIKLTKFIAGQVEIDKELEKEIYKSLEIQFGVGLLRSMVATFK